VSEQSKWVICCDIFCLLSVLNYWGNVYGKDSTLRRSVNFNGDALFDFAARHFVYLSSKTLKTRIVGLARQQLHFLCSDRESEAKESLALRWACLARYRGNLNSRCSD
jgi:hypothetical protein